MDAGYQLLNGEDAMGVIRWRHNNSGGGYPDGDLGRIKEGGHARVEIPSLGDKVFAATITEISWISTNMDVAQPSYYTVELTVPNSQLELKPGFKALVRFGAAE